MQKFTPGPWRASPYSSIVGVAITAPSQVILNTHMLAAVMGPKEVAVANAKLIAEAPAMAEALSLALDRMRLEGWDNSVHPGYLAYITAASAYGNATS